MNYVFQNDHRIYFFLEFVRGGNLFDHLCYKRRLDEDVVKFISAQVLVGLGYLHANKIIHRDLKPENVLMELDGYVKLADFGLAKFLKPNESTQSFCGTAEYLAPEILDMVGHGFAVDWWTFGVLIYEMITGRPPFMNKNHHKLGLLIRQGEVIFPDPVRHGIPMSAELRDIICKLLEKDPKKRLGTNGDADEVVNHPWFKDTDWDGIMNKTIKAKFIPELDKMKKDKVKEPFELSTAKKENNQNGGDEVLMSIAKEELGD